MLTYHFKEESGFPLYIQLYRFIKQDIEDGTLKGDERLPSKRAFAKNLGVSTITVENAYDKLASEGYIYSKPKSGFFVESLKLRRTDLDGQGSAAANSGSKEIGNTGTKGDNSEYPDEDYEAAYETVKYDFTSNRNHEKLFPFSNWAKVMRKVLSEKSEEILIPSPAQGTKSLRTAIAKHLQEFRGMKVDPEMIIIGAGTEYLYSLLIQLFGRDKIYALEEPGYVKISKIYRANQVKVRYIPLDENGVDAKVFSGSDADILHISPSHHFPTGVSMPAGRRYEILRLAEEKESRFIIEDDYDSELRSDGLPMPTLFEMDTSGKVIYMNTFTKTLTSTIRISYMILPEKLMKRFKDELGFYSCTVSNFQQYTLAEFILNGYFESHINRLRRYYNKERELILGELKNYEGKLISGIRDEGAGLHFLIELRTELSDDELKKRALGKGIRISTLSDYYMQEKKNTGTLVMNYSSIGIDNNHDAVKELMGLLSED